MNETEKSAISDFLHILEEHRKNCEQQGKYVEAEIAKNRLDELKAHEDNRQREAMKARQIAERLGVEEAHMLEFQQFNTNWDKKMKENETKSGGLIEAMKQRHTDELKKYQYKLLAKQHKPKYSTELLNYRKIEEHLAKAKDYTQAHKIKAKADTLEATETEKWIKCKQNEMFRQETQFKNLKQQELAALQKRIQAGREEHKKQRHVELARLLQRYQNIKNELEAQQNLERISKEKQINCGVKNNQSNNRRKPRKKEKSVHK